MWSLVRLTTNEVAWRAPAPRPAGRVPSPGWPGRSAAWGRDGPGWPRCPPCGGATDSPGRPMRRGPA